MAVVKVQDLYYRYPGAAGEAVRGLSFGLEQGEIFGFLGPSGAGKSTLKKILIGVLKGYRGSAEVLGRPMNRVTPELYESIGVAFEVPNLYQKFTALENLELFRSLYSGKTADPLELLTMVGLEDDASTRVSSFSKGMRMRLNFCRAFLNYPELVFLDEPTSGLDPTNVRKVKDIIKTRKAEGTTVFLATHNMQLAEDICDRIAFIVDGQVALIDSPRNLKLQKGQKVVRLEYRQNGLLKSEDFPMDGIGDNGIFLTLLKEHDVETMHTLEATMEDIFIQVTGRSLV